MNGGHGAPSDQIREMMVWGITYGRQHLESQQPHLYYGMKQAVPPVGNDLLDAREIVAKILENNGRGDSPLFMREIRRGGYDHGPSVPFVLQHLQDRREP